ncbi:MULTISPECIES: hypothetical protein [unclassified Pseudoalteromonas]|uniref:hypothetical protein n=1 Tax=unclassified Pseudoalteromonas TaxID=194690 RepID=UPI00301DFF24
MRHGQLEADSQLINPQLISQNGRPTVTFWQTLTGNRSLYGNFELLDSNNLSVGEVTNVAVYTPLSRRKVYISLQQPVVGPLTLKYKENPQYGGNIELAIPVNIQ